MKIKDCIIQESKPDGANKTEQTLAWGRGASCCCSERVEPSGRDCVLGGMIHTELMTPFRWVLVPHVPMVMGGGCGRQGKVTLAY